jgi:hypothetical protein
MDLYGPGTRYVHVGSEPDSVTGAVVTPISLGTTFQQLSPGVPRGAGALGKFGARPRQKQTRTLYRAHKHAP